MIATDRFVFLHLHKSGGTFVNEILLRHLPDARQLGYHLPRHLLPPSFAALPVLGTVRNPWSYYVSWFSFQQQRPRQNALYRVLSAGGSLDFKATITNMLELDSRDDLIEQLVNALPAAYGSAGFNVPGFALATVRGAGVGFYTWLYRHLYDGPSPARIARMEHLRDEITQLLGAVGQPLSEAMSQDLQGQAPRNVSKHAAYVSYYDSTLRQRVARRDAPLIAAHRYAFGD